ncbi:amidohydrolase 2 [Mycena amicta]|nr:amidohydrolase 2 [Mycena amicta]
MRGDTTEWNLEDHLSLMANQSIVKCIFSVPNPNIFTGNPSATVAISRLLNENLAALSSALVPRFGFFATTPLPYVNSAISEAMYALDQLGAHGIALSSNHEARYLGDPLFRPFFSALDISSWRTIIFLHPNEPLMQVNGSLVKANPTRYSSLLAEFYFETARTMLDLVLSRTLTTFTRLRFIIPHLGGSFPSILDRTIPPGALLNDVMSALRTRCWWDSAGLTYAHQIGGLLAFNISSAYLLYGSDYPYISATSIDAASQAIMDSPFLTTEQKTEMRSRNAQRLFDKDLQLFEGA